MRLAVLRLSIATVWVLTAATLASTATSDLDLSIGGLPQVQEGMAVALGPISVLRNEAYAVGYSKERLSPLWACYRVFATRQEGATPDNGWNVDWRADAGVRRSDFYHTGFELSHMAPKAAIYHCYGDDALKETFLMSNATPQLAEFNNGIWRELENLVREHLSVAFEEVWIITGPVFDDTNGRTFLTKDEEHRDESQMPVEIPDAFYKIIIDDLGGEIRALGFVFDHFPSSASGGGGSAEDRLIGGLRSIRAIEEMTGLDFLALLDEEVQAALEETCATDLW
jgi:endonuclease G